MEVIKDKTIDDKKAEAEKIAKELSEMNDKDLEKVYWLMQGIKIARSAWNLKIAYLEVLGSRCGKKLEQVREWLHKSKDNKLKIKRGERRYWWI